MEDLARLTPATIDVLRVLSAAKTPVWGLQIVKSTERPSGSVYPILERLENIGWIASEWESDEARSGARRRYFHLQDEARVVAAEAIAEFERRRVSGSVKHPRLKLIPGLGRA